MTLLRGKRKRLSPHHKFVVQMTVALLLGLACIVTVFAKGDFLSDFLFGLPNWLVVAGVIAWPLFLIFAWCLCLVAGVADEQAKRALAERPVLRVVEDANGRRRVEYLPTTHRGSDGDAA